MQYALTQFSDWQSYKSKVELIVATVKEQGAQLLLLPEYAGLEMAFTPCNDDLQLFTQIQPPFLYI